MTGKTTDEAVEKACAQMGLSRDEVSVEILEMPQKKLFGSSPAKVRVTALEDAFSVSELLKDEAPAAKPAAAPAPAPAAEKKAPAPVPEKATEKKPQPQAAPAPSPAPVTVEEDLPEEEIALADLDPAAKKALEYLQGIASGIGAEKIEYKAAKTSKGIKFLLDGDDASVVIGRRGETMDAIQYLCTLISSRSDEDYCKITLDVANYRKKREKTLIALAQREAEKVKKTKYSQMLEPMNPYERRIVHSAVQNIEGVKSESTGVEPNRRVVISLISGGKQGYDRSDRGGRGGRGGHGGHGGRNGHGGHGGNYRGDRGERGERNDRPQQRPAQEKPVERTEAAKRADEFKPSGSMPLYGKIDL